MEIPIRVLIIVKRSPLIWKQAWDEPQKIITQVLKHLKYDRLVSPEDAYSSSDCRFMAVERWDSHVFIICDLFNIDYNPLDAHLAGKNELPVRVVRVYQGPHTNIIKSREPQAIGKVGDELRIIHDVHGWNTGPPYKIDHADGVHPVYRKPRSLAHK